MIGKAALVFAATFWLDFVWARYTAAITARLKLRASALAGFIILLSGAAQISYVENHWLLIPAVIGAVAGTWVAIPNE